ncbi:sigma-54 dependent transcriptional regulator [Sphingomonas sp.]|uniref:sigma-54-dependent transcriptional regulator n=1 Tax=Sphingomonas sp. TaxID=28214 RepID=UPI002B857344|nr:sigma-54 dependent transcriptional regulator [Sphingomonas sp.]HTG37663.1 sigma-54 dependent transcriptional regulator [Sphingomonas sp.]
MTGRASVVALVEDDADLRRSMAQMLRIEGHDVTEFDSGEAALQAIGRDFAGPVVTDVRMPGLSGIDLFRRLIDRDSDLPVLLVTGHGDIEMAVAALKVGAWDFLTKPFDPAALLAAVARAASHRRLVIENRRLRAEAQAAAAVSPMIGRSPAIARLRETVDVLARVDLDVLIEGESGTGKELLARLIHSGGTRRGGRFVALACAALPEAVIDGDLFSANGPIAGAHGGTLFLDDVDRATPALQARLAEFAETRMVGARGHAVAVPCRIIATAGESEGTGADNIAPALRYRLAGMRLRVPPLRERHEDVPMLFAHFVETAAARLKRPAPTIDAAVRDALIRNPWPGNVRQLLNVADRFVLGLEPLAAGSAGEPLPERVAAFERDAIIDAVLSARGEVSSAIQALGLPRKTFYYKVARHGIDLAALRRALG